MTTPATLTLSIQAAAVAAACQRFCDAAAARGVGSGSAGIVPPPPVPVMGGMGAMGGMGMSQGYGMYGMQMAAPQIAPSSRRSAEKDKLKLFVGSLPVGVSEEEVEHSKHATLC